MKNLNSQIKEIVYYDLNDEVEQILPPTMSPHKAALICHVSPMTIIRWIHIGELNALSNGKKSYTILRENLLEFCRKYKYPVFIQVSEIEEEPMKPLDVQVKEKRVRKSRHIVIDDMSYDDLPNEFTTHSMARILHVTPVSIINWVDDGHIKAYKTVGGHRRILREDFERFCAEQGIALPWRQK